MRPANNILTTPCGDRWAVVGYTRPRWSTKHPSDYRLVRERDGARVYITSTKCYWLEMSQRAVKCLDNLPAGYAEYIPHGAKIEKDRAKASEIFHSAPRV